MNKKISLLLFFLLVIGSIGAYFYLSRQKTTIALKNPHLEEASSTEGPAKQNESDDVTKEVSEKAPSIENAESDTPVKTSVSPEMDKLQEDASIKIEKKLVSWGFSPSSGRKIDTIIIHSSYNALGGDEYDIEKLIQEYKEYGVAPHYLIDRKGKTYQLVEEKNIAYHAGVSKVPDGRTEVNNFSLGIEMINTKKDSYSSTQYSSLNSLLSALKSRYSIKYVLGHEDIAPGRKTDPWNFDWKKLK